MTVLFSGLSPHTSYAAAAAQLTRASGEHILLHVPRRPPPWTREPLEWQRLRRRADDANVTVGVVTWDPWVRSAVRQAGLAAYASRAWGEWMLPRRGRWRKPSPRYPGAPTAIDGGDRSTVRRRARPRSRPVRWIKRYAALVVLVGVLAILAATVVIVAPGASITLRPLQHELSVSRQVVVDPRLTSAEADGASIPGRLLVTEVRWQADAPTSGVVSKPAASARGDVVFANLLPEPVTVPAGTRVSTSGAQRIVFQTTESAELPPIVNGQTTVSVVAVEPGSGGNVAVGQINRVSGALAAQVRVRNSEPMQGGAMRTAPAVTQGDIDLLTAHIRDHLVQLARAEMLDTLQPGEQLVDDSVRLVQVLDETASVFPGEEAARVTAEVRAIAYGTAVDVAPARGLMLAALRDETWAGYALDSDSVTVTAGEILGVDNQGRVNMALVAAGRIVAQLSLNDALYAIRGQELDRAHSYLAQTLPLAEPPQISVWPEWHTRLPHLPVRMSPQVDVSDSLEPTPQP